MDPVDVLRELTRVGGVLAPVVLERRAIRRVGEVETCDESPPAIAQFVIEHRLRETGANEGESEFRLLRRFGTSADLRERGTECPRADMPGSTERRGEVVERAERWKAPVEPTPGGTTLTDQMIADRDQLIDVETRSELAPHVGGTHDREPLNEDRIAEEARQAMADDPGDPGRSVWRPDADMHLVPAQPRRERSIQEVRGRQVREELRRCHSLGVRPTQLQVREMTMFGRQVRSPARCSEAPNPRERCWNTRRAEALRRDALLQRRADGEGVVIG